MSRLPKWLVEFSHIVAHVKDTQLQQDLNDWIKTFVQEIGEYSQISREDLLIPMVKESVVSIHERQISRKLAERSLEFAKTEESEIQYGLIKHYRIYVLRDPK